METLLFLLGTLVVLVIAAAFIVGWISLNSHAEEKYGYTPISLPKILFMLVPYALFYFAGALLVDPDTFKETFSSPELNAAVAIGAGVLLLGFLFFRLTRKTNFPVALAAFAFLLIAGAFAAMAIVVAVAIFLSRMQNKSNRIQRRDAVERKILGY